MKKILIFICLASLPYLSLSQFHTSIDLVGSYDFKNEQTFKFGFRRGNINTRKSYRFGANFNFRVFDQGLIKTGIRYAKQVQKVFEDQTIEGFLHLEFVDEYYLEVPLVWV